MRRAHCLLAIAIATAALASCTGSGSGSGSEASDGDPSAPTTTRTEAAPDAIEAVAPRGDPATDCPEGFSTAPLAAGTHEGFASAGQARTFHLLTPEEPATAPLPLFVSITGTVQEEQAFLAQSGLDQLPDEGWIVVAPVRNDNGKVWGPWDAMRTPQMTGPNPDAQFIVELVDCLAAHHPVDADRVFAGGISIGGTMVNHLLRHHPDTFAGGIVGSGNFILTEPPDPQPLGDQTVIVAWGGDDDQWIGCPDGRMGEQYADEPGCVTADFVADAAAAAAFYDGEDGVRLLTCEADVGHIWISDATRYWAGVLAASPKGTTAPLEVGDPPEGVTCQAGPAT